MGKFTDQMQHWSSEFGKEYTERNPHTIEIMDGLYLGARLKYLRGTANLTSQRTDLTITTEGDPIAIRAETDYRIRSSFPMEVSLDNQGLVDGLDFTNSFSSILSI